MTELIASDKVLYDIEPKCQTKAQPMFGFTKHGELIPCCWLDTGENREDPEYQKLLSVSKITDYESIEDILLTDEWLEFAEHIKNKKTTIEGCTKQCKKGSVSKKEIYIAKDGKVQREEIR